jgi:hypothetical protein
MYSYPKCLLKAVVLEHWIIKTEWKNGLQGQLGYVKIVKVMLRQWYKFLKLTPNGSFQIRVFYLMFEKM